MATADQLRRFTGHLFADQEELAELVQAAEELCLPASASATRKNVTLRAIRAIEDLTDDRDSVFEQVDSLHGELDVHFGRVNTRPTPATAPVRSKISLPDLIAARIGREEAGTLSEIQFIAILKMPVLTESLLGAVQQLADDPPPLEVWSKERNTQALWVLGRAGSHLLEYYQPLRRAALQLHRAKLGRVLSSEGVSFEEQAIAVDQKVQQRLENLRERGLYVLPRPSPPGQTSRPGPRSATVTPLRRNPGEPDRPPTPPPPGSSGPRSPRP